MTQDPPESEEPEDAQESDEALEPVVEFDDRSAEMPTDQAVIRSSRNSIRVFLKAWNFARLDGVVNTDWVPEFAIVIILTVAGAIVGPMLVLGPNASDELRAITAGGFGIMILAAGFLFRDARRH